MRRVRAITVAAALLLPAIGYALTPATPAAAAPTIDALDGAVVSVESAEPGRMDLFTRGPDSALHQKTFVNGAWTGWNDLGGSISSAPSAVSWGAGRLDVFARSTSNTLVQRTWTSAGGWADWADLGGVLTAAPSAASWGPGHLDVFIRGASNSVQHKWYLDNGWSGWADLGGSFTSAPAAASYQNGHVEVFVRGTDNALWHAWFLNGAWSTFSSMGGTLTSAPGVTSWGAGHLDVFVRGQNNLLEHRFYSGSTWSNWISLGGGTGSAPTATSKNANQLDTFSVSPSGELQQKSFGPGDWPATWTPVGEFAQQLTTPRYARTVAFQGAPAGTALKPITYAYVDNLGRLRTGVQRNPDIFTDVTFTVIAGNEAFSGVPALGEQEDRKTVLAGLNTDGDVWTWKQANADTPGFGPVADAGGWVTAAPAIGKLGDGRVVLFAVGRDGRLWAKTQTANNSATYGDWIDLGDADLAGVPTVAAARSGVRLFATDTAGVLKTADFSGTLSGWTTISDAGVSGPAAVVYPGFRTRVFVRAADGTIQSKFQNADGTWPAAWGAVGTFVGAGAPAAILDPGLGRTAVVVRGADNEIYRVFETGQGTGTWGDWERLSPDIADPAATDPTVAPITNGSGDSWIIVFRNLNDVTRVYTRQAPPTAAKSSAASAGFTGHSLPAPPAS